MSALNPKRLLKGKTTRLIDEWQLAPKLWDAIRFEVDHRGELGQFVLTGSAVPADTKEITHSGTGRFTWITMMPLFAPILTELTMCKKIPKELSDLCVPMQETKVVKFPIQ